MADEETRPALVALRQRRQEVIDCLTDNFARDLLDVDDFEMRVDQAHRAASIEALDLLTADLTPPEKGASPLREERAIQLHPANPPMPSSEWSGGGAPAGRSARALATNRPERRWAVAIMGGVDRKGGWRVPQRLNVVCLWGGAEIDFRDVVLPPGVTHVMIYCIMGGADIIVPPDLAVECDGIAIMGAFEQVDRAPTIADPDAPLLRISGIAFMGGFTIATRLPGESARDAKKRKRRERRELAQRDRRELASGK